MAALICKDSLSKSAVEALYDKLMMLKRKTAILQQCHRTLCEYLCYFSMQGLFDKQTNIYKEEPLNNMVFFCFPICVEFLF